MQIAQMLSVLALCVAVVLLAISNRRAHDRITVLEAENCALSHRLMILDQQLCELDKGLRQATKMGIAAHAGRAKVVRRLDGITNKLNGVIESNNLKSTKPHKTKSNEREE